MTVKLPPFRIGNAPPEPLQTKPKGGSKKPPKYSQEDIDARRINKIVRTLQIPN
jgi:hypothetical protein